MNEELQPGLPMIVRTNSAQEMRDKVTTFWHNGWDIRGIFQNGAEVKWRPGYENPNLLETTNE